MASRIQILMSVTTWLTENTPHSVKVLYQLMITVKYLGRYNYNQQWLTILNTNLIISAPASVQLPCRCTNQLLEKTNSKVTTTPLIAASENLTVGMILF